MKFQNSSAEENAFAKANAEAIPLSQWPKPSIPMRGPRNVQASRDSRVLVNLLFGVGLVISTIGGLVIDRDYREVSQLERSGQTVQARIYRYDTGDESISARFVYEWNGESYNGKRHVRKSYRDSHPVGSLLTITVLPTQPQIYRAGLVTPGATQRSCLPTLVITGLLVGLTGIGVVFTRRAVREQRRILQDWPAVAGVVQEVTTVSDGEGGKSYRVKYRYPMVGTTAWATTTRSTEMAEGDVLDLLVNPNDPMDVRPYWSLYFARMTDESG